MLGKQVLVLKKMRAHNFSCFMCGAQMALETLSLFPSLFSPNAACHHYSDSLSSSQHSVDSNMSEISTDTVPTPSSAGSLKIKQEPDVQGIESGPQVTISTTGDTGLNATGAVEEVGPSPRKKPRKQQHM